MVCIICWNLFYMEMEVLGYLRNNADFDVPFIFKNTDRLKLFEIYYNVDNL